MDTKVLRVFLSVLCVLRGLKSFIPKWLRFPGAAICSIIINAIITFMRPKVYVETTMVAPIWIFLSPNSLLCQKVGMPQNAVLAAILSC